MVAQNFDINHVILSYLWASQFVGNFSSIFGSENAGVTKLKTRKFIPISHCLLGMSVRSKIVQLLIRPQFVTSTVTFTKVNLIVMMVSVSIFLSKICFVETFSLQNVEKVWIYACLRSTFENTSTRLAHFRDSNPTPLFPHKLANSNFHQFLL